MSQPPHPTPRPSYGVDAPFLLAVPVLLIAFGILQGVLSGQPWPFIGVVLVAICACLGFYASKRGKFLVWSGLLDELDLDGGETVLDLGCGRGAVLMAVAKRLSTGRAVGIDVWNSRDQSANSLQRTRRNALAEGVTGLVELYTADVRSLPFEDDTFDLILSNTVIHNVKPASGRERAIQEAVRVLSPGGRLLVADIRATGGYRKWLIRDGMSNVTRRNLGWRMWYSGPWLATRLVSAIKPEPEGIATLEMEATRGE